MEAKILPRPEVVAELENFVTAELFTDAGPSAQRYQRLQEDLYKTVAIPLYAVLTADGRKVDAFPGLTRDPQEFVRFLKKARASALTLGEQASAQKE